MLVIVSDLHLKDGTCGVSITPDAFRVFVDRLNELAYRASWRADGSYRPIDELDLVLLGDVFDHIHTTRWLDQEEGDDGFARPWSGSQDSDFIRKIREITRATLEHNAEGFEILRQMSRGELISLPPGTKSGQPDQDEPRIPVKVNIHQLCGNHDWFFHLPGNEYDQIRQEVIDTLGLANTCDPFPHDPQESDLLMETFRQHQVFARHGDIYDKLNFDQAAGRDASTVGDALAVELVTRFPLEVYRRLGDELPPQFNEGLKEMTNVRPALVTPLWISNLVKNYAAPVLGDEIKRIWDELGEHFLELDFVRAHDRRFSPDVVDGLQGALLFSKALPFDTINQLLTWMTDKFWGGKISFAQHALEEDAFKKRKAQFIVFGHTHFHETVPLDTSLVDNQPYNQLYINSGTWHTYHDLTLHYPEQHKFIGMNVMTYISFFKDDERHGRPLETWSGALAAHF
jgi:hypothetical protein